MTTTSFSFTNDKTDHDQKDKHPMRKTSIEVALWRIWIGRLVAAIMLAALSATFAYAQKISPEEQKLVDYIDAHTGEATALLEKTVNIESPTENLTGVKQVGAVFKTEFESLGFSARWINMPAEMKRAGHLLAEKKGTKGKRVLLLGHIDTVLSGEKFRREGNKAFGTGSSDMKAGVVVLYFALKALRETGARKDARDRRQKFAGCYGDNYFCRRHSRDAPERRKLQFTETTQCGQSGPRL